MILVTYVTITITQSSNIKKIMKDLKIDNVIYYRLQFVCTLLLAYPKVHMRAMLYKVDQFVLGTLSSSFILLNTNICCL